jgi:hypothetical protein
MQRPAGATGTTPGRTPTGAGTASAQRLGGITGGVAGGAGAAKDGDAAAVRQQMRSLQEVMAARTARICVRYGRDKLCSVLATRERLRLQRALLTWRFAASSAAVAERGERQRLQAAVAADQARAERGVYEQARMQLSRERKAMMLQAAVHRWRDVTAMQQLADDRALALSAAARLGQQLGEARVAAEAGAAQAEAAAAAAAAEGDQLVEQLHSTLAAAGSGLEGRHQRGAPGRV